ncbi:lysine (K)-specific demethylase 2Aa isoform X2 [Anguilla anguilla]|uniref:lysine (K)-specific demethylase 2Aa isoform X2 n=1 Tax=Anguilla anguilla TaxID=7936 RepID=UPI0015B04548|nr:lysine (K)-specific demethylase 2Aa isoform X2 [Anguilla anguilla]
MEGDVAVTCWGTDAGMERRKRGMVTLKRSGTRRRYQDDGISDDEIEGKRTFDLEEKLTSSRFSSDRVKRMEGKDFTFEYIQRGGLRDPIIFEKPDGLGIKMPDPDFSVNDVKVFVGSRRVIDVMDVTTQKGIEMSMAQWRRYYETPPAQREKLYNVISLEFSHTKLENLVKRPASVDIIDWVDNMWPRHLKERQRDSTNAIIDMQYPKVQKYCLMSVQGCYTDFHVDFGGTSVWYHILRGGKVFWLIPPTPQNLELYENWVLSGKQGDIFLGDKATDCQRIELKQGYTFMIPSGWIHAVYTPVDTLVFGGNFLHSFNIPMQLHISNIEDRTRVPAKFRYPFYYEMCWYVLERYLYSLTNTSHLTPEFQKYSLGIGLKREPSSCPSKKLNGHIKDEDDEDDGDEDEEEEEEDEEEEEVEEAASPPAKPGVKVHLTPFELEGLWNLLGKLESLPSHKKCVPAGIHNAPALLHDIRTMLQEHANDNPKLSYTGIPIIKWPKRPSWYQPPPPPPPVGRPRLSNTVVVPRPVKPPSSMSVLRRRRVRCKRCEACLRTECGDCNFCRDMKKFGGPGKLKQTCVLRQCLAPGLPLSAACEVCGEGNPEPGEATTFSHTLMECSNCAQIAHPGCLKVPGEGVVNKDLPSCWECPKCVLGKESESESSGSDDDSVASASSLSPPAPPSEKHSHREGVGGREGDEGGGGGGGRGRGRRGRGAGRPLSSLSSAVLQNRKRAGALELRLRKRIKLERNKILHSKRKASSLDGRSAKLHCRRGHSRDDDDDDDSASEEEEGEGRSHGGARRLSLHPRGSHGQRMRHPRGAGPGRRGLWRGSAHRVGRGGGLSSNSALRMRRGMGARGERGGRVRLRGGGRMQRRREETDDDDDDDDEDDDDEDEDEESEDGQRREGRVHRRRGRAEDDDDDEDDEEDSDERDLDAGEEELEEMTEDGDGEENQSDSDPDPPVLLVSDLSDDLLNGSYLTVTLQRPPKAKRDPGSIVPKLEAAVSARAPQAQGYVQRKSLQRPRHKNGSAGNGLAQARSARPHPRPHASPSPSSSQSSVSPTPPPPASSCSPPWLLSLPSFRDVGNEPGCEKEVWVSVFRYLTRAELCVCMTVCKSWYKWSCDKRLWTRIDLSRCRSVSPQALSGIIKRQPVTLDLSWTSISKKQLTWLINRLPGLKDLIVSGCSWSSISALSSPSCPLLRTLDLRWAEGVKDSQIRDLITPPGCDNRSKLRNMQSFRLAGLEISDSTLRLIIRHMPLLARLDLAHCRGITDQSVNLLTAVGSSTRNTLTEINLAGCNKLTDGCLLFLKRVSSLTLLDLRGCKGVTRRACESFISELSINALFCLSEDKLVQRIS